MEYREQMIYRRGRIVLHMESSGRSHATDQSTEHFEIDAVHVLAVQFLFGRF